MIIRVLLFYFSAAEIRDQVLDEDLYGVYSDQEAREIRAKMPHSIVNTLSKIRARHWGVLPQTRDQFDIQEAVRKAETAGGDSKIIVFDSNNVEDLPEDWQTINLRDIVTDLRGETPGALSAASVGSIASVGSSVGSGVGDLAANAELIDEVSLTLLINVY